MVGLKATDNDICEAARAYLRSGRSAMDPTVIEFLDTHEIEVVPGPFLTDISWSDRGRPYYVHSTIADLIGSNPVDLSGPGSPLRCTRCSHGWRQRGESPPTRCPWCNSPYWDRARTKSSGRNKH